MTVAVSNGMRSALTVLLVVSACVDVAEAPFELRPVVEGRFDQAGSFLSDEDLQRVEDSLNEIVRRGEAEVRRLERVLADLDDDNDAKRREIDAIEARIEDREEELEDAFDRNFTLCLIITTPECAVATFFDNDSRLSRYRRDKARADAELRRVRDAISEHDRERDELEYALRGVRRQRERILALLGGNLSASASTEAQRQWGSEVLEASRLHRAVRDVAGTYREEVRVLSDLIDSAVRLQAVLNRGLFTLRRLDEDMAALLAEADRTFIEFLEAAIAGNLERHARDYLDRQLHARARQALRDFGISSDVLVDFLVENRMPSYDEVLEEHLRFALADDRRPLAGPLIFTQLVDRSLDDVWHDTLVEVTNAGTLPLRLAGCLLEVYEGGEDVPRAAARIRRHPGAGCKCRAVGSPYANGGGSRG
ncbi:MAG: hypothetical protein AAF938_12695 [Myxococcota bacterium]